MMQHVETARRNLSLTVLAALALAMIVAGVIFFMGMQSAGQALADLEQQEVTANIQLMNAQATYDLETLRQELNDLEDQIAELSVQSGFPESVSTSKLSNALANNAAWNGVTVVSLSSPSKTSTETIGSGSYDKYRVEMTVSGSLEGIQKFVTSMEGSSFPTLRFDSVTLAQSEGGAGWQGDLKLAVITE